MDPDASRESIAHPGSEGVPGFCKTWGRVRSTKIFTRLAHLDRNFTHVDDIIRADHLVAAKGAPVALVLPFAGWSYRLSGGRRVSRPDMLYTRLSYSFAVLAGLTSENCRSRMAGPRLGQDLVQWPFECMLWSTAREYCLPSEVDVDVDVYNVFHFAFCNSILARARIYQSDECSCI